ncbi:MAG TPA: winged helix-turn-helix domain-containing protein [Terriglobia bacterium]|nr:winged helix-turn-helix domain-containing protein [Terriglobia bacterium]
MDSKPTTRTSVVRFGVFRVEVKSQELYKNGFRVKLQNQAFQALTLLLERAGEVVTREELRRRLWPGDTFVDFDEGLNAVMKKLRYALGDSAGNPRFIETLPRVGYRFIAPVIPDSAPAEQQEAQDAIPQVASASRRKAVLLAGVSLAAALSLAAGYFVWRHFHSAAGLATGTVRVAVLPLENLSHDPEQEYFADGITDELITKLARFTSLEVRSRTSVMGYKGVRKSLSEIASELRVDAVMEGTVARSGNTVRITAQLIDARTDRLIWADDFEGQLTDMLRVQNDLARSIADGVRVQLTNPERDLLTHAPAIDAEAYEFFLRGLYFYNRYTSQDQQRAIEFYQKALSLSPKYAPAHLGLASSYFLQAGFGTMPARDFAPKAEAEAMEAVREDRSLGDALCLIAIIRAVYDNKWAEAESEFKRGLELSPNSSGCHQPYSFYLAGVGRREEAVAEAIRARELDPLSPIQNTDLAVIYSITRENAQAIEQFQRTTQMFPSFKYAYEEFARAYFRQGMPAEAITEMQAAAESAAEARDIARAYKASGYRGFLQWDLKRLLRKGRSQYIRPTSIVWHYALLNDRDNAFRWLERACAEHDFGVFFVNFFPEFDTLRSDPRYQSLIRRTGLPN